MPEQCHCHTEHRTAGQVQHTIPKRASLLASRDSQFTKSANRTSPIYQCTVLKCPSFNTEQFCAVWYGMVKYDQTRSLGGIAYSWLGCAVQYGEMDVSIFLFGSSEGINTSTECIIVRNSILIGAVVHCIVELRGTVQLRGTVELPKSHHLRIGPWSKPGTRPSSLLHTHPCHL